MRLVWQLFITQPESGKACCSLLYDKYIIGWSDTQSYKSKLTNSMDTNPSWEANNHLTAEQITHLLWNPDIHKNVSLNPVLNQTNGVHTLRSDFWQCI
jgi:hypothetical protein